MQPPFTKNYDMQLSKKLHRSLVKLTYLTGSTLADRLLLVKKSMRIAWILAFLGSMQSYLNAKVRVS
jgi:hypothetical protein